MQPPSCQYSTVAYSIAAASACSASASEKAIAAADHIIRHEALIAEHCQHPQAPSDIQLGLSLHLPSSPFSRPYKSYEYFPLFDPVIPSLSPEQ